MKIYMAVTADPLELPVAIADTCVELSRLTGISTSTIHSGISRGHNGRYRGYKFIKLVLDEDIDKEDTH